MNANATEHLMTQLEATQKQLIVLLESVAHDQDWQPNPSEWSFRYLAAHLATVDRECFKDRVVRIAAGEKPHFESYFNTGRDFSRIDLRVSLGEWAITRQEIFDFVQTLPEEACLLMGTHASFGTITVLSVLGTMLNHDREHLQHLEQLISEYRTTTRQLPR